MTFAAESTRATGAIFDTIGYTPDHSELSDLIAKLSPTAIFSVGGEVSGDAVISVAAVRWIESLPVALPEGVYWINTELGATIAVINSGSTHQAPVEIAEASAADNHALIQVASWIDESVSTSTVVSPPTYPDRSYAIHAATRTEVIVDKSRFKHGSWTYQIRQGGRNQSVGDYALEPLPDESDVFHWIGDPDSLDRFSSTLTRAKLNGSFTDTYFSYRATKTLFRAYQFRPVIRLLETEDLHLLIADEVGLGKTIEAGLIWTEMDARGMANRVLVVCPSALVDKWRREMLERFGYEMQHLDKAGLRELLERLERNAHGERHAYVVSTETFRTWEHLEDFDELGLEFDLVIADEAHVFRNSDTKSHALALHLETWANVLVLLSATPLNLGNKDLFNLLQILAPGDFADPQTLEEQLKPNGVLNRIASTLHDSMSASHRVGMLNDLDKLTFGIVVKSRPEFALLRQELSRELTPARRVEIKGLIASLNSLSAVVTRTRKADVDDAKAIREARVAVVEWSAAEIAFYEGFLLWCKERADASNTPLEFSMQMPLRTAASCLPAAARDVLSWKSSAPLDSDPDDDPLDFGSPNSPSGEIPPSAELIALAELLPGTDSKFRAFRAQMRELVAAGHRSLVFTFARKTVNYLMPRLTQEFRVATLHGLVGREDRSRIMADFRDGKYDFVVCTRVASEGLDFEFCSAVINYDLPWNPMEIEQRIGRIDRFGQESEKIQIVNFTTPNTIETKILDRVMTRIGVFEESIGQLEPIVGKVVSKAQRLALDFNLSASEQELKVGQVLDAIEGVKSAQAELETARDYLVASDNLEVDGLEDDLKKTGRYFGQYELAHLIHDWAGPLGGRATIADNALTVTGTQQMAEAVRGLGRSGKRNLRELERVTSALVSEGDIHYSLDQEWSRTGGPELIDARHPLVLASLAVREYQEARCSHIALPAGGAMSPGTYVTVFGVAEWTGVRRSKEIWTQSTNVDTLVDQGDEVGDAVMAHLAAGTLQAARLNQAVSDSEIERALHQAVSSLDVRRLTEEQTRMAENEALMAARHLSSSETYERRRRGLEQQAANQSANPRIYSMMLGKLKSHDIRHQDALRKLDERAHCSMSLAHLAVAVVRVTS